MAVDDRLREALTGLDGIEGNPTEDVVGAVLGRGRRYRRVRRLVTGALVGATAIIAIAVVPKVLDMSRGAGERLPAVPAPGHAVSVITTFAGDGCGCSAGDGGLAAEASIRGPNVIGFDRAGNLYVSDDTDDSVRRIDPSGVITTAVGPAGTDLGATGRVSAAIGHGLAVDPEGSLYVQAQGQGALLKITPSGKITTVAGTGHRGYSGDGGLATEAQIDLDYAGVVVDEAGNVYIAEYHNDRVRKVDPEGIITTIAGTGTPGFSGDGGPARDAELHGPESIALDGQGNLYVADVDNHRIRKIDRRGIITTVAGNGKRGFPDDGAEATAVPVGGARVTADVLGNLYVTDEGYPGIFRIDVDGVLTIIAGTGVDGYTGDGGLSVEAQLSEPTTVALGPDGALYISDWGNNRVRRVVLGP
jgi:trimeric autotransporter adhesin